MRSFTTVLALASVVPAVMSLTINTPSSVVQCQPQLLTWDGTGPFYLSIIPGGQPSATPLKTFDTQTGNSLTWKCDQPAGTKMTFSVKDNSGAVAYTDIVTVQQGPDSSCLGNSGVSPAPAPPAAPPAAQDVSVNTANVPTSGSSSSVSSSVVVQTGTIRPTSSVSGVTASRAASVAASVSASATQSVSRTSASARAAATSSSSAESSLSGRSFGFVGAVGLIGALFL